MASPLECEIRVIVTSFLTGLRSERVCEIKRIPVIPVCRSVLTSSFWDAVMGWTWMEQAIETCSITRDSSCHLNYHFFQSRIRRDCIKGDAFPTFETIKFKKFRLLSGLAIWILFRIKNLDYIGKSAWKIFSSIQIVFMKHIWYLCFSLILIINWNKTLQLRSRILLLLIYGNITASHQIFWKKTILI